MRNHGDFRARTRIACRRLDLDHAFIDFRHFLREQARHEFRLGAREEDLRALGLAAHVIDVSARAVADAQVLARNALALADDALGAAEIDDHIVELDALDDAVDDLADAILVFAVLALALGLANLVIDHLLGRLRGDAAELDRRQRLVVLLADDGIRIGLLGHIDHDVGRGIERARLGIEHAVIDHRHDALQRHLAGFLIDRGADIVLGAIARARRFLQRVLHRLDNDLLLDRLFARHRVGDLQDFEAVSRNAGAHLSLPLPFHCSPRAGSCQSAEGGLTEGASADVSRTHPLRSFHSNLPRSQGRNCRQLQPAARVSNRPRSACRSAPGAHPTTLRISALPRRAQSPA